MSGRVEVFGGNDLYTPTISTSSESKKNLMCFPIGSSKPAYATALGKAIIAFLPEAEQDTILSQTDFIAFTKNTITSPASFKEELLITKQRGYAKERGELEDITTCCSAPIFDFSGRVIAAISFSDIYSKEKEEQEQALIHDLLSVSGEISKSLGYIPHS